MNYLCIIIDSFIRIPARVPRHPAVTTFLTSESDLLTILEGSPEPLDPVLQATLAIRRALAGLVPAERANALAAGLAEPDQDPELRLILLATWATLSGTRERHDEMRAILRQAQGLVGRETPPELRVMVMLCEGYYLSLRGDRRRRETLLKQALGTLTRASPWYPRVAWEWAVVLAQQGRANEAEPEIRFLDAKESESFPQGRLALVRLFDAVESGRWRQARVMIERIDRDRRTLRPWQALLRIAEQYRALAGLADPRGGAPTEPFAREEEDLLLVTRHLLAGRAQLALRAALERHARFPLRSMEAGFTGWDMIRAELACGNGESARRLVAARRKRGSPHWLDGFFLARAERLAGKSRGVARLREARREAARLGADGRFELELRLATEIPPGDPFLAGVHLQERSVRPVGTSAVDVCDSVMDPLVGTDPEIVRVREVVRRLAPLKVTVLVTGETGTGKELVARALHEAGPRRARPFVAVNCGAIAEALLESELFGHERGAFTGAERAHRGLFTAATGGTLFLDEIGEVSPRLQAALLRVLENGEVRPVGSAGAERIDCRVVAATNADLDRLVDRGLFRKDLLYRLRRLEIALPPLRDRPADILPLALHFLNQDRPTGRTATMTPDLADCLRAHLWPGNVRELKNRIERMLLLAGEKAVYTREDFDLAPLSPREPAPAASAGTPADPRDPLQVFTEGRSTLRRRERLKALFHEHRMLTRAEAVRILDVAPGTVTTDLKALAAEGVIEKVMPRRAPRTHFFRLRTRPSDRIMK